MRVLVISDIHANLTALEAVLADAEGEWDKVWCLGDVIGYGPDPNECVEKLRKLEDEETVILTGNHDQACLGLVDLEDFNPIAREASEWTNSVLTDDTRDWLKEKEAKTVHNNFTLAHGSPSNPIWEYVIDTQVAENNFHAFSTPFCLVGHSHYPCIFSQGGLLSRVTLREASYGEPLPLNVKKRMIINPGSVGQPRDGNPKASYALLDTEALTWFFKRVEYDVAATQARMRELDLHEMLI